MQEVQETQVPTLGQEDSPGVGNGSRLQCSGLHFRDRGAWRAAVRGLTESRHDRARTCTRTHLPSLAHGGWGGGGGRACRGPGVCLVDRGAQVRSSGPWGRLEREVEVWVHTLFPSAPQDTSAALAGFPTQPPHLLLTAACALWSPGPLQSPGAGSCN